VAGLIVAAELASFLTYWHSREAIRTIDAMPSLPGFSVFFSFLLSAPHGSCWLVPAWSASRADRCRRLPGAGRSTPHHHHPAKIHGGPAAALSVVLLSAAA